MHAARELFSGLKLSLCLLDPSQTRTASFRIKVRWVAQLRMGDFRSNDRSDLPSV